MFLGIVRISIQGHITLAFLITQLFPFSDFPNLTQLYWHPVFRLQLSKQLNSVIWSSNRGFLKYIDQIEKSDREPYSLSPKENLK